MFEHCPFCKCIWDKDGYCEILKGECEREIDSEKRCIHSGFYLMCGFAFYDGDELVCGADTGNTKKYVKNLPFWKYDKKLAVADLPKCMLELLPKSKGKKAKHINIEDFGYTMNPETDMDMFWDACTQNEMEDDIKKLNRRILFDFPPIKK